MASLKQYLRDNKIPQSAFADQVKSTQSYISQIINGDRVPSLTLAARIEQATGGQVKAISLACPQAAQAAE